MASFPVAQRTSVDNQGVEREREARDSAVFDASQYEFFGHDVSEEVELGGLEDEEEDLPAVRLEDDICRLDSEEGDGLGSLKAVDDLANKIFKLNQVVGGTRISGFNDDLETRDHSSAVDCAREVGHSAWYDQRIYEAEHATESEKSSSLSYGVPSTNPLYRTSSHPEPESLFPKQPQQHFSSEPISAPRRTFSSYPSLVDDTHLQASPNNSHFRHQNFSYVGGRPQVPPSSQNQNLALYPVLPVDLARGSLSGRNLPQFFSDSPYLNNRTPGQLLNKANLYPVDQPNHLNQLLVQGSHQNGSMLLLNNQQQQHTVNHQVHSSGMHRPHLYGSPHLSASLSMVNNKPEGVLGFSDMRDQNAKSSSTQRSRLTMRHPQQVFGNNVHGGDVPWPQFRSKYMMSEEIENIMRMQLAAMHSNDPYVDDYYHQACLAKKSSGARLKHHFCPNQLRELSPHAHPNDEPHAFLQVEALGRIPFSSIRRPKPLLQVDSTSISASGSVDQKISERPLAQEPLLTARVTIEDGFCLLLDIDDIDRFLHFNQHLPDGGAELKQRRQTHLEALALAFHLVDPLAEESNLLRLASEDDLVFLQVLSLPKGRKLLSKYLEILSPSNDLLRIVLMTIFRHLRFIFSHHPSDLFIAETTSKLAVTVSARVGEMDLHSLSSCLAAAVCSSEQPLLRPIGSSAGDGASVVLKSVLERATELLKDPKLANSYNLSNRDFWQASFDKFFGLLVKYCISKYDSIIQSMILQAPQNHNAAAIESDVARAIRKEMPVELLRASLPHTNEQQRKLLMEFAQRSVPTVGVDSHVGGTVGHVNG